MVREAVPHEPELPLFDVLFDGVERLFLGDFHLGIGPSGNLDNHVEDPVGLVGEEREIMERRENGAVVFDEDAMLYNDC